MAFGTRILGRGAVLAAAAASMAVGTSGALAIDIPVTTTPGDLEAKVIQAAPGDVLVLASGQYSPSAAITISKNLTIRGPQAAPGAIIAGANVNTPDAATQELNIFRVNTGVAATFENVQLQITNATNAEPIDTSGAVSLRYSTISGSNGAGVNVRAGGSLTTLNSTIAENLGNGITAAASTAVTLDATTVANNGQGGTGAAVNGPASVTLSVNRSILASTLPGTPDCLGGVTVDAGVSNLSSDSPATCGPQAPTSPTLNLGPLQGNGGPTDTILLGSGSSAIDKYASASGPADDQRRIARPIGPTSDIGATELGGINVPANIVLEGNTVGGRVVTYTAPTTSGGPAPTCTSAPAPGLVSGSTFPVGTTTITCTATGFPSKSFTVTITDTLPPTVTPPAAPAPVAATSPSGATVTFGAASATDIVDGSRPATCLPASGSTFAPGITTVTCTASDTQSNQGSATFNVVVRAVSAGADKVQEATGPGGAVVTFPAATVLGDALVVPACTSAPTAGLGSGSTFPIGITTITCTSAGALADSLTVEVKDTTGPAVTPPSAPATAAATSASGAVVTYGAASATDVVDGARPATCAPASGSTFAPGATTVTCSATDTRGNVGKATFVVTVSPFAAPAPSPSPAPPAATPPSGGVTATPAAKPDVTPRAKALAAKVKASKLATRSGLAGLLAKPTCANLGKFVAKVKAAQKAKAKGLSAAGAKSWIAAAEGMRRTLGC